MSTGSFDPGDEHEIARIAAELRAYLEQNEGAADTLDGIVRWWWQLQRYRVISQQVERALTLLEAQGVVGTRRLADGKILYFLSREAPRNKGNRQS